jgi:hypothetical protein
MKEPGSNNILQKTLFHFFRWFLLCDNFESHYSVVVGCNNRSRVRFEIAANPNSQLGQVHHTGGAQQVFEKFKFGNIVVK